MKKICIVPVCYNAHEDATRLLESIELAYRACSGFKLHLVLCDNSTIKPASHFFSSAYSFSYKYLKNENIGYFPAFNRALSSLPEEICTYDYVIVCNVDLVVSSNFFSVLTSYDLDSAIGVIAPGIYSIKKGIDLNPKMIHRPSAFKINFMRFICSKTVLFRLYHSLVRLREIGRARFQTKRQTVNKVMIDEKVDNMYGAHGSFLIFTKNYFKSNAHVAYPRFLFGEEGFVAEQLRMNNLKIKHCQGLVVFDREHSSTSKLNFSFICSEHKKSYDFFYQNFIKTKN